MMRPDRHRIRTWSGAVALAGVALLAGV